MIGWSLNLISKFLAIRLESLFFKIIPKDMLVLFRSRNWKNSRFRWFGRAPSVLINHRKCSVSSDKWSIQKACNHRKGLNGQKESSCFRTSQMSKIVAMMRSSNRRKLALWGDDTRSWGSTERFQTPAYYPLHNHFQICAER
jgi:hypothetical protein